MTSRKVLGTRLKDKAARGEYELVVPFDFMLLEHLPETGTLFAGMFPLGETVANMLKIMNKDAPKEQQLERGSVYGRIRSLEVQGLVSQTKGASSKRIWQRTTKGTKLYQEWKEKQSGSSTSK